MATFSHKGLCYHICEWGDASAPPLILLHGFSQSSATWEKVAANLAEQRHIIAPDLIGHGQSERPNDETAYEMGAVIEWLDALTTSRGAKKVDLLGYSMGGRLALNYACTHPDHIASLVLESTGLGTNDQHQQEQMLKRDQDSIIKLTQQGIEAFMDEWESLPIFRSQVALPLDIRCQLRRERLNNDPTAMALTIKGIGQHKMPDLTAKIHHLPISILYIAGTQDQKYANIAEQLKQNPSIKCTLIDAGHNTHLESPKEFCDVVSAFLSRSSPLGAQSQR